MGKNACQSDFRQHAGKDFESQVLLVAQSVCASLDDANLVVESLDEAERDFVLGSAIGGDAIPMTLDHFRKLLAGFQTLPLQAGFPVVEEAPYPASLFVKIVVTLFKQPVSLLYSLVVPD